MPAFWEKEDSQDPAGHLDCKVPKAQKAIQVQQKALKLFNKKTQNTIDV